MKDKKLRKRAKIEKIVLPKNWNKQTTEKESMQIELNHKGNDTGIGLNSPSNSQNIAIGVKALNNIKTGFTPTPNITEKFLIAHFYGTDIVVIKTDIPTLQEAISQLPHSDKVAHFIQKYYTKKKLNPALFNNL